MLSNNSKLPCLDPCVLTHLDGCCCCALPRAVNTCVQGKRCFVSGSGNVAQYAAEKLIQLGAVVLTLSDSTGYIYEKDGFTQEQVQQVRSLRLTSGMLLRLR
jgi:glutamate dehydrogenase/leucine dehydrogenase